MGIKGLRTGLQRRKGLHTFGFFSRIVYYIENWSLLLQICMFVDIIVLIQLSTLQ